MNEPQTPALDQAAFQKVWKRVMPADRPDFPVAVDDSPLPSLPAARWAPCLGETSAPELPGLEGMLALTVALWRDYQALATRRSRDRRGQDPLPTELAKTKEGQLKRLMTAYFLISGEHYGPPPAVGGGGETFLMALRRCYHAEQTGAAALLAGAAKSADPCLAALYRELGEENQRCAGRIREWMEQR